MNIYPQEFIEEMKQRLLEAQARLEADLAGLNKHTELGNEDEDNAAEVAMDEVSGDLHQRIRDDLDKIAKALAKVRAGTYGFDDTGKIIGEKRLRAMPWADTAI